MNSIIASIAEKTRMTDRMMRRSDGFYLVTEAQIEQFAQEIVKGCIEKCAVQVRQYKALRKGSHDFDDKNIYAEGEIASDVILRAIKREFGVQ